MLEKDILRLKAERSAIILAHNYQPADVQDIADLTGDSLELSRAAATIDCRVLVFCGVDFMAETAAILSPDKIVIHPDRSACCPMAQMISPQDVRRMRDEHPEAAVVCYVNSSAGVKAESDICCTSANGVQVVNSLDADEILFLPDRNLAAYVARHTTKRIIPWNGYCYVHDRYTAEDVKAARMKHPDAELLVHPECRPEVIDLADGVYSTSGMLKYARASGAKEFIIGTEIGILHRLCAENPEKLFYPLSGEAVCADMKKTSLKKVLKALETLSPKVEVPQSIAVRARRAIERMLAV